MGKHIKRVVALVYAFAFAIAVALSLLFIALCGLAGLGLIAQHILMLMGVWP